jgi:hypothetical protein
MRLFTVKRLTLLAFLCGLAAACGANEAPHSDYFVVTFLPNTPAPSQAGLDALDHAVRQAVRHVPAFIGLSGAAPEDGAVPELTQQRIAAITEALVRGGVDPHLIRDETRPYDAKSFAARKDSFILQLAYGKLSR